MFNPNFNFAPPWQKPPLGTLLNLAHPLSKGLVGLWLMNEGSGDRIYDLSGNGNVGTLTGGVTWDWGRGGPAPKFGGSSSKVITTSLWSSSDHNITISAWIKTSQTSAGTIIGNYTVIAASFFSFYIENGLLKLYLRDSVNQVINPASSASVNKGTWKYVTVVLNGTTATLYINGSQDGTATNALFNGNMSSPSPPCIGATPTDVNYFNGLIDDVRIYNRALSAQEVWQLYTTPYCMFEQEYMPAWMIAAAAFTAKIKRGLMTGVY